MNNAKNLIKFLKTVSANIDVIIRNMTGLESFIMKRELEDAKCILEKTINVLAEGLIIAGEAEPTITEAVLAYQENIVQSTHRTAKEASEILGNNLDHVISIIDSAEDDQEITERMRGEMNELRDFCRYKNYYLQPSKRKAEPEDEDE